MSNNLPGDILSIDYTDRDYEAFRTYMLNGLSILMPEYTDRSQTDAGIVIIELLAKCLDILSFNQDVQANEVYLSTLQQKANALKWCNMLDYKPHGAIPAKFYQVFKLRDPAPYGGYVIPKGTKISAFTDSTEDNSSVIFETDEDLLIPIDMYGDESSNGVYTYPVSVTQGYTVGSEDSKKEVGFSNASASQKFYLERNTIETSIAIYVNDVLWTSVDSLVDSNSADENYTIRVSDNHTVVITFGDGICGKIPQDGAVISAIYRVGGGVVGNVSVEKINTLITSLSEVEETFNPYEATVPGADEESLAEIKRNVPVAYRARWGCLTLDDFAICIKWLNSDIVQSSAVDDLRYSYSDNSPDEDFQIDQVDIFVLSVDENGDVDTLATGAIDDPITGLQVLMENRALVGTTIKIIEAVETADITTTNIFRLAIDTYYIASPGYSSASSKAVIELAIKTLVKEYFALGNREFGEIFCPSDLELLALLNINGLRFIRFIVTSEEPEETNPVTPAVSMTGIEPGGTTHESNPLASRFHITPADWIILALDETYFDTNIHEGTEAIADYAPET